MKIGMLTQPLHDNYGGLLQAYALKETLQFLGHEVVIINRRGRGNPSKLRRLASIMKSEILGRRINPMIQLSKSHAEIISKETVNFRKKFIPNLSESITDNRGMDRLTEMGFDAYLVGSDQCWRPCYSPNIRNYFLDFVENQKNIRRVSYAASFGVSNWEFNDNDTIVCAKLLQKFDGISVREDSGVELVKRYLGREDAIHVIDPTMLLSIEKYMDIATIGDIAISPGGLKIYILDKTPQKISVIKQIAKESGYTPFEVLPLKKLGSEKVTDKNVGDFVYPDPTKWLRGFQDAKFVVTDSFHGTVFSILFNVPFITIGNVKRGMARFESLLNMFGLKDRLIIDFSKNEVNDIVYRDINWKAVNTILKKEQNKAINFLISNFQ